MQISKKNFSVAKSVRKLAEDGSPLGALHLTNTHTEVTNGHFAIRMTHSPQAAFEFEPTTAVNVQLSPEDAMNIASSLGKESHIKAVIPVDDGSSIQVEFDSGEIRILKGLQNKYPDIKAVYPNKKASFSIGMNAEYLMTLMTAFRSAEVDHILMEFWGSDEAIRIRPASSANPEDPEVSAVLMPMRTSEVVELPGVKTTKQSVGQNNVLTEPLIGGIQ